MKVIRYLIFAIISIILLVSVLSVSPKLKYNRSDISAFQKRLNKKIDKLDKIYYEFIGHAEQDKNLLKEFKIDKKDDIGIYIYKQDSLIYWADDYIPGDVKLDIDSFNSKSDFIYNSWYVIRKYNYKEYRFIGSLLIKNVFVNQNRYLRSGFQKDFKLPPEVLIDTDENSKHSYPIYDQQNNYLLSLNIEGIKKYTVVSETIALILFLSIFLFLLLFFNELIKQTKGKLQNILILLILVFFIICRISGLFSIVKSSMPDLFIFGSLPYAHSRFIPSIGDLLINSIILLFVVYQFNTSFNIEKYLKVNVKFSGFSIINIIHAFLIGIHFYSVFIFQSLIFDSNINFETYKTSEIGIFTFIGLLIIFINYTVFIILINWIVKSFKNYFKLEKLLFNFTLLYIPSIVIIFFAGFKADIVSIVFPIIIYLIYGYLRLKNDKVNNYSTLIFLVFLFSLYTVYFIEKQAQKKNENIKEIFAENLEFEHDPIAEYLFEDMSEKMQKDKILEMYLFDADYSIEDIYRYLNKKYFSSYWKKYNYQITVCSPYDSVFIEYPYNEWIPCYRFFDNIKREIGIQLPNTGFTYIENFNGKINYMGNFSFFTSDSINKITLFMELESKLITEKLGYPELLLDEKIKGSNYLQNLSYAKYYQNKLIAQSGTFSYGLKSNFIEANDNRKFTVRKYEDYQHLIYKIDEDNIIVISEPQIHFFDIIISCSYIFVFYYLTVLMYLLFKFVYYREKIERNFKNRIQFSIIAILLISLLLIGGGTIYFIINQYQQKHNEILTEKVQSVYIELDHKLAYESELNKNWSGGYYDNLDQMLKKFADVFYTDINLYDPNGDILASSRNEIFHSGLQGEKMNPVAYQKVVMDHSALFVNKEKIGKLTYLSAYAPFVNVENELLAYLNLPYFIKQEQLTEEITTLSATILNIYVILILLTVLVAVFITDNITKPLYLVQQKLRELTPGKKYEKIDYKGNDEISGLVAEYNNMVQEMAKNIDLLAKSERESAWREMAKQVAHEIKNPLTPMKLNIQHLQRSWNDKSENFEEYLKKATKILIEQIDNLSKIATEFSDFAKMPGDVYEKVDLVKKIENVVHLFSNSKNINIELKKSSTKSVFILADKEQISRAFVNLLKNAVQSIPAGKEGKINIEIKVENKKAVVIIKDNGRGIDKDIKEKLFTPYFTTKSSGMGLGLAITKNIIENCKGTINFETRTNIGTTFIVEFPVISK